MEKSRSGMENLDLGNTIFKLLEKLSVCAELSGEGDGNLRLQCGQGGRAHLPGVIYLPAWRIRIQAFFSVPGSGSRF
jgi:hypothetical protein